MQKYSLMPGHLFYVDRNTLCFAKYNRGIITCSVSFYLARYVIYLAMLQCVKKFLYRKLLQTFNIPFIGLKEIIINSKLYIQP